MYTTSVIIVQSVKYVPNEELLGRRLLWISRIQVSRTRRVCARTFMGPSYE